MKNKKVCDAKIWHGSGHQSRTKCHLTREHIIHEAYYGAHNQLARWIGDEVCSEFFNEPPEFDENNDKIKESKMEEIRLILEQIKISREIISKERDKLRDILVDLESVIESFDDGMDNINIGVEHIENGLDDLSTTV